MAASFSESCTLTDGTIVTVTATIPDANAAQVVAYLMTTLPQQNDATGAPIPRTPPNLIKQWMQGNIASNMAPVNGWIASQAAAAASAAAPPIVVTLT